MPDNTATVSKQEQVVDLVKLGTLTRKEIIEKVGCTSGAFASYLSGMRNAAKFTGAVLCPVEVEKDGKKVFTVDTFDNVEAAKAARQPASKESAKTPEQRYAAALKRVDKAKGAVTKSEATFKSEATRENELYMQRAKIELELAEIALANTPVVELPAEEVAADAEVDESIEVDETDVPEDELV